MSQEEFKAMLDELVAAEEERLQVGSEDFLRRHQEIMELIGEAERVQEERRQKLEKQFIGAKEVAEILGVSESKGYGIIRELNAELKERGFITVRGKVSRAFFSERLIKWRRKPMAQKRPPIPENVFKQICMEMAEAELGGDFRGMFTRGGQRVPQNAQNVPDQPIRESFLSTFKTNMNLYKSTFMKIYGYELTWPGFVEEAITRLEILGCSRAREYYTCAVAEYKYKHEKEMINVAEWYRKEAESDEARTRQQEADKLKLSKEDVSAQILKW